MNDVLADQIAERCPNEDVGGEVHSHSDARDGNQARKAVSEGRYPTLLPVSLGNDGGQGKGCRGMTRRERSPARKELSIRIVITN